MNQKIDLSKYALASLVLYFVAAGTVTPQKIPQTGSKPVLIKSNVLVVDAAGKYVDDVTEADIKVLENGVEQKIAYFAKKDPWSRVCLVIDNSGSMNYKQGLASSIGKTIVENLNSKDESMLIRFVSRDKITTEEKWTSDKKLMREALDNLFVEGGQSAVIDGVYLAFELMLKSEAAARSKRHAVVVVTDGEERDSYYSVKDLRKLVSETDVQVFAIVFTGGIKPPSFSALGKKAAKAKAEKLVRSITAATAGLLHF